MSGNFEYSKQALSRCVSIPFAILIIQSLIPPFRDSENLRPEILAGVVFSSVLSSSQVL